MMRDQAPQSDEARALCERAEDYMRKIRSKELHFTEKANALEFYDPQREDNVVMPEHARRQMNDYDEEKIEEAEWEIKLENLNRGQQYVDTVLELPENRKHAQEMLTKVKQIRFLMARNFLHTIDQALTNPTPLLVEGEAFFAKLKVCEEEKNKLDRDNATLKEESERLSADLIRMTGLYEECEKKRNPDSGIQPATGK